MLYLFSFYKWSYNGRYALSLLSCSFRNILSQQVKHMYGTYLQTWLPHHPWFYQYLEHQLYELEHAFPLFWNSIPLLKFKILPIGCITVEIILPHNSLNTYPIWLAAVSEFLFKFFTVVLQPIAFTSHHLLIELHLFHFEIVSF